MYICILSELAAKNHHNVLRFVLLIGSKHFECKSVGRKWDHENGLFLFVCFNSGFHFGTHLKINIWIKTLDDHLANVIEKGSENIRERFVLPRLKQINTLEKRASTKAAQHFYQSILMHREIKEIKQNVLIVLTN